MTPVEIRELRHSLGMTQVQMAQFVGVHALTVSKWERGVLVPSPYHAALLQSFGRARNRTPNIGEVVTRLLMGAGIGVALYHILRAAFEEDED